MKTCVCACKCACVSMCETRGAERRENSLHLIISSIELNFLTKSCPVSSIQSDLVGKEY